MYTPSASFLNFHIAGFQHWDGALALPKLKPGKRLKLKTEPDNPYDPQAVALYYKGAKLGYVPRKCNGELSLLLNFGHTDVFEAVVLSVNPKAPTWEQVYVSIRVRDVRKK